MSEIKPDCVALTLCFIHDVYEFRIYCIVFHPNRNTTTTIITSQYDSYMSHEGNTIQTLSH